MSHTTVGLVGPKTVSFRVEPGHPVVGSDPDHPGRVREQAPHERAVQPVGLGEGGEGLSVESGDPTGAPDPYVAFRILHHGRGRNALIELVAKIEVDE
jgi:hypothetical protein